MPTKLSNLELLSKTDERIFTQSGRQLGAFIIVFRNVYIVAMNDGQKCLEQLKLFKYDGIFVFALVNL